jgi:hypothetical protein
MKIQAACLKDGVRHPALSRAKLDAGGPHGDEITFEGGLLLVKPKVGPLVAFPVHCVHWMEPMAPEAKKPKPEK